MDPNILFRFAMSATPKMSVFHSKLTANWFELSSAPQTLKDNFREKLLTNPILDTLDYESGIFRCHPLNGIFRPAANEPDGLDGRTGRV